MRHNRFLIRSFIIGMVALICLLSIGAPVMAVSYTFNNTTAISIVDAAAGDNPQPSTPIYPTTVTVTGVTGNITQVTVTLNGLSHTWTTDVDILLAGPGGQNILLISDVGSVGARPAYFVGNTITIADGGSAFPTTGNVAAGTYQPSNTSYTGDGCPHGDTFPAPAPTPSSNTTLAATFNGLNGSNVNGNWSLYAVDDCTIISGSLSGWSLSITDDASSAPTITSGLPGNGTVGAGYSHTYTATGSPAPTFSLTSGTLPGGLNLIGGVLSGTPTTGGSFNFTVTASNGTLPNANQAATVIINQPPAFTSGAPAAGTVGTAYSHTFTASGYPAPTFSVTAGSLPGGLNLASGGLLDGTPTASGTFNFTVTATNGAAPDVTQNVSLVINPASAAPTFTSGAPGTGVVGTAYSHTFTANGVPAPTFSVTVGTLPGGLNLASGGLLDGTPTTSGTFNFTVTATNGIAPDATQNVSLVISDAPSAPIFTSGAPAAGTVGTAYSHTFSASGFPAPTFSVTAGSLPPGLTLNSSSGALTGTPASEGSFNFTVTATNAVVPDATQSVTLVVSSVPVVVPELPPVPPATPCTDVNFEDPGIIRSHFTNDADRAGLRCGLIAAGGTYRMWNGGPITFSANIGNQTVLDLGVIAAVDVFSTSGQTGFVGDVNICLQGSGYMIYLNANSSPRVPQLWSAWTTDAFPGYTCTTLYAPGTVILVQRHP